jgi:hypothetical protein
MSALHRWAVDVSGIPAAMSAYMFRNLCTRTGLQRTNEIDGHQLNVSVYSAHVRRHADNDTIGQLVSELEEFGHVEQVPDPNDGRAKVVRYTAQGTAMMADALAIGVPELQPSSRKWLAMKG